MEIELGKRCLQNLLEHKNVLFLNKEDFHNYGNFISSSQSFCQDNNILQRIKNGKFVEVTPRRSHIIPQQSSYFLPSTLTLFVAKLEG